MGDDVIPLYRIKVKLGIGVGYIAITIIPVNNGIVCPVIGGDENCIANTSVCCSEIGLGACDTLVCRN